MEGNKRYMVLKFTYTVIKYLNGSCNNGMIGKQKLPMLNHGGRPLFKPFFPI